MTRDELENLIYERTRCFVDVPVADCIFDLIAAEREACAKICDETRYTGYVPAEDGGARQYYDAAAEDCAEQIRARGEQEQPR